MDSFDKVNALTPGLTSISVTTKEGGYVATCLVNVVGLPSTPSGEYGNAINEISLSLRWIKAENSIGYEVYASEAQEGQYIKVGDVSEEAFYHGGLKPAFIYYYKIRSYNYIANQIYYSEFTAPAAVKTLDNSIGSKLFLYMSDIGNQNSVFARAVALHNGDPRNTCAYTVSEALRVIGLNLPNGTARTEQVEMQLKARGYVREMNLSLLQPGDIAFTTDAYGNLLGGHSTHTFIFMGWANKEKTLMNICDNQVSNYGSVYHTRTIYKSSITDATAFFYHTDQSDPSIILKLSNIMDVKPLNYNSVQLSWSSALYAGGYKVYRATSVNGSYSVIGSTAGNSFIDTSAVTGKTYYYKVRPFSVADTTTVYGNYTSVYSAKTTLSKPTLSINSKSKGKINLTWMGVPGANGYEVYRAKSKTAKYSRLTTTGKTSFANSKLSSKSISYDWQDEGL